MSYKNRPRQPEDIWPENRCLYYSDFTPTHYRKSDGYRVQFIGITDDSQVLYSNGKNTSITALRRWLKTFAPR